MPYLVAAVILLGCLTAVNLLLVLGVTRRLREHGSRLDDLFTPPPFALPGTELPDFTAVSLDGSVISRGFFTGAETAGGASAPYCLVGVFSTDCSVCRVYLPGFVERAKAAGQTLAIIAADDGDAAIYADDLAQAATIVVEPHEGPVGKAFQVTSYPTFFLVDAGAVIVAVAGDPAELSGPALA
ncbi:TlpA family protein disulfide reductase [Nonomuraea sp. KM88]|uniref:TlpA family protein disulfide reductase n=1 Tax=Nonomuraea sp. KM88 TaxID=3457427 RepID=UPI003FCE7AEF